MKYMILFLAFITFPAIGVADETALSKKLEEVTKGMFKALQEEDIETSMGFFHPDAPNRELTKQAYESKFPTTQLTYELSEFSYFGKDEKFAAARVIQRIGILEINGKKVEDPRKATLEFMILFKRSGDSWKVWKSLEIERQNPS